MGIQDALDLIQSSETGRRLIVRALKFWGVSDTSSLAAHIEWGEISRTDAVLTRIYDPITGKETRERKVTVYLKRDQGKGDLVLDLAHELTHATAGPSWDPYDPDLTASKYIRAALESEGGEIDALYNECKIGLELSPRLGVIHERCEKYFVQGDAQARQSIQKDFYRVGKWKKPLKTQLGAEVAQFPLLSSEQPVLYSSTGQAPYPVALLREYEEITRAACENTRRRIQSSPSRAPASDRFLNQRCGKEN